MSDAIRQALEEKWQLLEDKMMLLIAENERLHKENAVYKFEREESAKRLHGLISLMDSVNKQDALAATSLSQPKPMLIQG